MPYPTGSTRSPDVALLVEAGIAVGAGLKVTLLLVHEAFQRLPDHFQVIPQYPAN